MREKREFRAHHSEFEAAGVGIAGVSLDSIERSLAWSRKLHLPYPLLADTERVAGAAFGVVRRVGIGAWGVEWFRRSTFLADRHGIVRAVWEDAKTPGHAPEVLAVAKALHELPGGDLAEK